MTSFRGRCKAVEADTVRPCLSQLPFTQGPHALSVYTANQDHLVTALGLMSLSW